MLVDLDEFTSNELFASDDVPRCGVGAVCYDQVVLGRVGNDVSTEEEEINSNSLF